ncbi:MAG: LCP family protein [Nakamurella sp.]
MTGGPTDHDSADDAGRPSARYRGVPTPTAHRHPFLNYSWHIVVAVFSVFVLAVTGVYWNIVRLGDQGLTNGSVDIGLGDGSSLITRKPGVGTDGVTTATTTVATSYTPQNFLLVGSDTRAGANNIDGGQAELAGIANTDSMMVLHISGDRQHIYAMSLPRDMWAPNVPCQAYNQDTDSYGGAAPGASLTKMHMNAFYGVGGPKCLVDAVENLTQLPIDHYIQIDFSGFSSMVDALNGVTVNACGPIVDETLQTILPNGGEQVINGAQALNLARARKVIGDPASDLSRIHRQQLILSAILREVKSTGTLLDPGKLTAFVNAFTQNTSTGNVTFQSLMDLAESVGNLDPARVNFYTIPTVPDPDDTGRGSMFIDETGSAPLLNALRNDEPVPGSETPPVDTAAPTTAEVVTALTVAPGAVDLEIVNATGSAGVASSASAALDALGFATSPDSLKTADPAGSGVTVQYSAGNEAAALTVAAAVPGATLEAVDGLGSRVSLRVGTGWDQSVTAVAVGDPIAADLLAQVPAGSAGNVLAPTDTGTATTTTSSVNAADTTCL